MQQPGQTKESTCPIPSASNPENAEVILIKGCILDFCTKSSAPDLRCVNIRYENMADI